MALGNFMANDGADNAIDVANGQGERHFLAGLDRRFADFKQDLQIERFIEAVVLGNLAIPADIVRDFRLIKNF